MNKRQYLLGLVFASIMGATLALGGYQLLNEGQSRQPYMAETVPVAVEQVNHTYTATVPKELNFVEAAKQVTPGVVHIRSTMEATTASRSNDPFDQYFRQFFGDQGRGGYQQRPSVGTGSGVIISSDGYIATNNHVIDNATDIEILLNDNRTYKAKLVGVDPTTDLALLKIEEHGLPVVTFANSDVIEVGEWVLAIGNPFEFRSTVTAGIVSAKGRNINILRNRKGNSIESFIQTDAAVNPGNSGGALVDLSGQLVGINTAIATPTGSYAGYSFAVPSNLIKKVVADLKDYGEVQRALLGVSIQSVNSELAEQKGLDVLQGVYVSEVGVNSGAKEAGIKQGDVIVALNGQRVDKSSELQEKVAVNRPGDTIDVTYLRGGEERTVSVLLRNDLGTTAIVEATDKSVLFEGATFEDVSQQDMSRLRIDSGAKLVILDDGLWKDSGIKEGFIITRIKSKSVKNIAVLTKILDELPNGTGVLIEGVYPSGQRAYYAIGL